MNRCAYNALLKYEDVVNSGNSDAAEFDRLAKAALSEVVLRRDMDEVKKKISTLRKRITDQAYAEVTFSVTCSSSETASSLLPQCQKDSMVTCHEDNRSNTAFVLPHTKLYDRRGLNAKSSNFPIPSGNDVLLASIANKRVVIPTRIHSLWCSDVHECIIIVLDVEREIKITNVTSSIIYLCTRQLRLDQVSNCMIFGYSKLPPINESSLAVSLSGSIKFIANCDDEIEWIDNKIEEENNLNSWFDDTISCTPKVERSILFDNDRAVDDLLNTLRETNNV